MIINCKPIATWPPEYWDCWTMTDSLQWRDCQSVETAGVRGLTAYSDATARVLRLLDHDWQPTATRPPECWDCRSTETDSLQQRDCQSIETAGVRELIAYGNTTARVLRLPEYGNCKPQQYGRQSIEAACKPTAIQLPEYQDWQRTGIASLRHRDCQSTETASLPQCDEALF